MIPNDERFRICERAIREKVLNDAIALTKQIYDGTNPRLITGCGYKVDVIRMLKSLMQRNGEVKKG